MISKKDLEHLGELSRIEIPPAEEEKLIRDLGKILDHFGELKELTTDDVAPMTGGVVTENVFRSDEEGGRRLAAEKALSQFPEKKEKFLKIPPVF